MRPLNQYKDNLGTAILLVGGAGSGKTVLAMRLYPKTYVFVADPNFRSGKDYLEKRNLASNIVGFDLSALDDNDKPVPPNQRYARMMDCLDKATKSSNVDCIVIDSWSFVEDILKVKIMGVNTEVTRIEGEKGKVFQLWGDLIVVTKSIILQLRQSGKKLVITCHEGKDKDESDGIFKYELAIDGAMKKKFPAFMSDVWRCEVDEKLGQHTWNLRLLSNARQEHLKRSSAFADLPALLKQDDLIKHLNGNRI